MSERDPHVVFVDDRIVYHAPNYAAGIAWLARRRLVGWVNPTCPCCGEANYDNPADCSFCEDAGHAH